MRLPLVLEPYEARVIVIGPLPPGVSAPEPVLASRKVVQELDGDWSLSINGQSFTGPLKSWQELGVRDVSGAGTYTKEFVLSTKPTGKRRIWLECADVRDYADVRLNGVDLQARGWQPYRWDLTRALKRGQNVDRDRSQGRARWQRPGTGAAEPRFSRASSDRREWRWDGQHLQRHRLACSVPSESCHRSSGCLQSFAQTIQSADARDRRDDKRSIASQGMFLVSTHQSGSLQSAQSGPANISTACLSPFSCQSSHARTALDQRRSGIG